MKKKSIFLALILMILFLLSGTVNAQTEYTLEDYHYTNPVYKDIEINQHSEAIQPYSLNTADEVYTSDVQKIAEKFRQELVGEIVSLMYIITVVIVSHRFFLMRWRISCFRMQFRIPESAMRVITSSGIIRDGRLKHPTLLMQMADMICILPITCHIYLMQARKNR